MEIITFDCLHVEKCSCYVFKVKNFLLDLQILMKEIVDADSLLQVQWPLAATCANVKLPIKEIYDAYNACKRNL